jgi:hypothetical protein
VPKSAAAAGIGYEALCLRILALARLDSAPFEAAPPDSTRGA